MKTIRYFSAQGYRCSKSGGSLGAWDIIGVGPIDVVLLQVKTNKWPGPAERATLAEFPIPPSNVRKILVRWDDYARAPQLKPI